jgi:GTP pyrophosphokinase
MATAEADIVHVDMGNETAQDAAALRFVLSVRDLQHLDTVLRQLRRTPAVIKAERLLPRS